MPTGATSDGGSLFDETLDTIVTTVKWIIGSAATVLAALLAGLQLSDLGALRGQELAVALAAYAAALLSSAVVLIRAAAVLVKPGFTVSDLADRELRARQKAVEAAQGDASRLKPPENIDPLLAELFRRGQELLPGGTASAPLSLQDFYNQQTALGTAWATVRAGGRANVGSTVRRLQ